MHKEIMPSGGEQMSLPFEAPQPEQKTANTSEEVRDFSHLEANDECQVCGNAFESTSSCQQCASNKKKRAYVGSLKNRIH